MNGGIDITLFKFFDKIPNIPLLNSIFQIVKSRALAR